MTARNNAATTRGKPFQPGNPGRPHGSRHRVTLAVEALLEGEAEALTRKAVEKALEGDTTALRLCLDRIAPAPKERSVTFALPQIVGASDLPPAIAALLKATAEGHLAPGEAASVASLLDKFRAACELAEIEARLSALEVKAL